MKSFTFILSFTVFFVAGKSFSQRSQESFKFFGVRSYSGELLFRGFYRDQDQRGERIVDKQQSYYYSGGILLNASTYLLHPNFCTLELGAGYMPESGRYNYLISPDFSEVRTVKKVNLMSSFFNQKKISAIVSANYDESYAKRENMTDIKTINKYMGGTLIYTNKVIPLSFDFFKRKLDQNEIQSGRSLNTDQTQFEGRAEQSFTSNDRQSLIYSHRITSNRNENNHVTKNTSDDINFNSNIDIGPKKTFSFNTTVSNSNQYGSFNFNSLKIFENLTVRLPLNFTFITCYDNITTREYSGNLRQYTSSSSLNHMLFKSLSTTLYYEYTTLNHRVYDGYNSKVGFDIHYTKIIPIGQLSLSYGYFRNFQKYSTDSVNLIILREQYQLSDNKIVLLKLPYIDKQTIVVMDVTGTIIYQPGLDYILIERGKYLEIRRIPSGLIPNDGTVYVDYQAKQSGSYSYNSNNYVFATNVSLLKGRLELYYRLSWQDYNHLDNTDLITLNYYRQHVVGFRVGFDFLSGGVEYESYQSSILPFRMIKYYISFQKSIKNKFVFSINGDMQNYTMLNEPDARVQRYTDVSGKVEYTIIRQTKLNLDVMYRNQQGRGINLDLLTARLELTSVIFQLYITAGVEVYRRNYIGDRLNFKGTYIQLARKF